MEDQNSLSESIVPSRAQPQILQEESMSKSPRRRVLMQLGALTAAATLFAACTSNEPPPESDGGGNDAPAPVAASDNDETGDTVTIGFSAPAADHGWMGAISKDRKSTRLNSSHVA